MAIIFLGFRRGGSSISFQILEQLFINSGYKTKDVVKVYDELEVKLSDIPKSALIKSTNDNQLVGVFRGYIPQLEALASNHKFILVVRDPRDCINSWFYARDLHSEVKLNSNLGDVYHTENDSFADDITELIHFSKRVNSLVYKYEDIVLDPVKFLIEISEYSGLNFSNLAFDTALSYSFFVNPFPDAGKHNRSGIPYSTLLNSDSKTVENLTNFFHDALVELDYPLTKQDVPKFDLRHLIYRDSLARINFNLSVENALRINEITNIHSKIGD